MPNNENLTTMEQPPGATELRLIGAILLLIISLTVFDLIVDWAQGVPLLHIIVEAVIIPLAGSGLYLVWDDLVRTHDSNRRLKSNLLQVSIDAAKWREESSKHLNGLSAAIDSQLGRWGLSIAEKEIALLLLKGLSHKEIAEIRATSERTVRQQALSVYEKSGLSGRAQLAAFFLEDLLIPTQSSLNL